MELTVYQNNFDLARIKYQRIVRISKFTIPLIIISGLIAAGTYLNSEMDLFTALLVGAVPVAVNVTIVLISKPSPEDYFPQVKLNDTVIYNPLIRVSGKDHPVPQYKISKEHPMLNHSIPKWEVVSIAQTSLVIKNGTELKELSFTEQKYLLVQNVIEGPAALNEITSTNEDSELL